jgi:diaminopimelate decarboxylase
MTGSHDIWLRKPTLEESMRAFFAARSRLSLDSHDAILFHDVALLREKLTQVVGAFPAHAKHTVAIKANPVVGILREAVEMDFGLEAASIGEIKLAEAAGCPFTHIVFDSPAKTTAELEYAISHGIFLNVDNFAELERVALLEPHRKCRVGMRINPEVGDGRIAITSVGGSNSRFGVPVTRQDEIVAAFAQYGWLTGLHMHIGSQSFDLARLVQAVKTIAALKEQIDAAIRPGRVSHVDIGGGLPWQYRDEDIPSVSTYAQTIEREAPSVFSSDVTLVTEFGRALQAGCGYALSRVEYVKEVLGRQTIVTHLGADFLVRAAYHPEDWSHDIRVMDFEGRPRSMDVVEYDIAGPLCFAGDYVARGRMLPRVLPGDWLLIRDVGAYTLGMWSRHCSRGQPAVVGVYGDDVKVLRRAESPEDIARYWGE